MPLYEVHHSISLTRSEKDDLAARITHIHKSAFGAPSLFISITFKDISGCDFYAGPNQQSSCNRIFAKLRTGGPRTVTDLENLSLALSEAWQDSVVRNSTVEARSLSGVFVTRSIEALMEDGFLLPGAGKDEEWLKQNLPLFQKRADEGSAGFQGLLKELGH